MTGPIVDPTDPEVAVLDDGRLAAAVHFLPLNDAGRAPTLAELDGAPIVGYTPLPIIGTKDQP